MGATAPPFAAETNNHPIIYGKKTGGKVFILESNT